MNLNQVTGLPIGRLREKYLVLIIKEPKSFITKCKSLDLPVYFDQQKVYLFEKNICYCYFYNNDAKFILGALKGRGIAQ